MNWTFRRRSTPAQAAGSDPSLSKPRGIGLVDVLIAMAVLGMGVVGLAKVQSVVFEESGSAKARGVAAQLAEAKLDDLRSFTQLPSGGNGMFGYGEIGNNTGGAENADGSLRLPSGSTTVSNVVYTRNWTAAARYFCATNTAPTAANCAGAAAKPRPDFYALAVTIGWTDSDGAARTLVLNGTASSVDPLLAGNLLLDAANQDGPIVTYVPGEAPDVIAIDIGGGRKIETSNPTPTLNKKGQSIINTIARYETVNYDSQTQTTQRRQFTTLNCSCVQQGVGMGEDRFGLPISKRIGAPADQFQTFECGVCCRDHHDSSACNPSTDIGRKGCYDPMRPTADYLSGTNDHNHYNANQQLANNVGDVYVESCRMERVDGFLRVAPDWNLVALHAIPESFFAPNGTPSAENIASYGQFVKSVVQASLAGTAQPAPIWSSSEVVAKNATKQLVARGIYIDYLDATTKANYVTRIAGADDRVFSEIPFYEVNLTKLAQWSSGAPTVATVSNAQLVTEAAGEDLYSRGLVRGINTGVTNATARARVGNTGVINEFVTSDPHDGTLSQSAAVSITVPGNTITAGGTVSNVPALIPTVVTAVGASGSPNVVCNYDNSNGAFSCVLPTGWSGSITPSALSYTFTPGTATLTNAQTNQANLSFIGTLGLPTYLITGTISPGLLSASVSAVSSGPLPDGVCTYVGLTGIFSCVVAAGWSGTVIPSAAGYSFAPGSYSVVSISSNQSTSFTATAVAAGTFTISGVVTAPPTIDVMSISPTGSAGATCTAVSAGGNYSCTVPSGWTGTLTPTVTASGTSSGISFTPTSYNYASGVSGNLTGQNFGTMYRISGGVFPSSGVTVVTGVSFSALGSGGSANGVCAAYNDVTGTYACTVPGLWSGSIIPSKSGSSFLPAVRSYGNVTSAFTTENYTAIVGATLNYTITVSVSGLSNNKATNASVQVVTGLSCGTSVVTGSGNNRTATIACTVPAGWNGSITPVIPLSGNQTATFSPASRSYTNVGSAQTATFSCSGGGC